MKTEKLDKITKAKIAKITANFNPETWIRFQSVGVVQIDGDMCLSELKELVKVMESIKD